MKSVNNLAKAVKNRWICNRTGRVGGCIINTGQWVHDDKGKKLILEIAEAFHVNVILVIDQERLYSFLESDHTLKKKTSCCGEVTKIRRSCKS